MPLVLSGSTGIVEANIANGAITTPKIADGAVVAADLASTLDLSSKSLTLPIGSGAIKSAYAQSFTPQISVSGSFSNFSSMYSVGAITLTPKSSSSKLLVAFNCGWTKTTSPVGIDFQLLINGSGANGIDGSSRFGMRYEGHRRAVVSTGYFMSSGSKLYQCTSTTQITVGIGFIIYDENSSFTINAGHTDFPLTVQIVEF
jgi:hypothetical protein